MESFKPPCRFNPDADENFVQAWKDWKTEFTFYLIASEKSAVSDNVKVGMLLCAMGPQWIKVYTKFDWNAEGDKDKLDCVIANFDKHIEPKKLLKSYITRFQHRVQTPNDTVTDYIQAVERCPRPKAQRETVGRRPDAYPTREEVQFLRSSSTNEKTDSN